MELVKPAASATTWRTSTSLWRPFESKTKQLQPHMVRLYTPFLVDVCSIYFTHMYVCDLSIHVLIICFYVNPCEGVLDGHGGKQCAEFAVDDLPSQIMSCLRNGSTYPDALYSSFLKTDKVIL